MNNVWIMNLKDNREDRPDNLVKTKFEFCKSKGILGIGWADEESKETGDIGFSAANNAIDSFEIGDIVWVKDPYVKDKTKEYYLCKITGKSQIANDEEMIKNDIGKYCTCKFYPVSNIPDDFNEERLIAIHTIEKSNETVQEKTISFFESFNNNKKNCKKKICIISIICICALILGIVTPKIIKLVNKNTHPILPNGLEFGMTYDAINRTTDYLKGTDSLEEYMSEDNPFSSTTYDVFEKKYTTLLLDGKNKVLEYLKLEKSEYACFFVFNQKKELYQIYLTSSNTISEDEYKELCNYFKKAFDETNIDKEHNNAEFISNNTRCEINNYIVHSITIESKKFQPFIPEISKETISDALNGLNYHVSGFSMNLFELLDESVSNMKIGYSTVKAAKNTNDNTLTDIKEELKDKYPEYAATSYLITVHGDICQNPDLPYLKREDVDVIKLVLIFDDYGNLIEHMVLERCEDLNTYAILTMFG